MIGLGDAKTAKVSIALCVERKSLSRHRKQTNRNGSSKLKAEMVDWFARQGPRIMKAWQEVGALKEEKA